MRVHIAAAAAALGLAFGASVSAAQCAVSRDVNASLDAADLESVMVFARAGSLEVRGTDGNRIDVQGRLCASHEDLVDDAELTADSYRGRGRVEVRLPETRWREYVRMDLVVEIPARLGVDIDDSSGWLEVSSVAWASIEDSSGDLIVEGVAGDVTIDDSSGEIRVRDVGGNVRVDDNSGDIEIEDVRGGVVIEDDGSGGIDIRNVDLDVLVEDDGSGSIEVAYIGGDFTVEDDGSGGIRYREVQGEVRIPRRRP